MHDVDLLPVTKSVPADVAAELMREGALDLGEARVDVLEGKVEHFAERGLTIRWHFIGHIQRNKASRVVRTADVIHSVDSPRLLETLERAAAAEGRRPTVYLQVNRTGEPQKHGMDAAQLTEALAAARGCEHLAFAGLMAMGPREERPGHGTAEVFAQVAAEAREIESAYGGTFLDGRCRLSMGMSDDLELAIAAGSNVVRVGSALFEGVQVPETEAEGGLE